MRTLTLSIALSAFALSATAQTGFKTDLVKTSGEVAKSGYKATEIKYTDKVSSHGHLLMESGNGLSDYAVRKTGRSYYWIEKGQDLKVDESSKPASSNDLAAIQSFLFNLDGSLFGTSKLEYKLSHTDNIQGTLIYRMQQTHLGLPLFDAAAVARVSNGQLSSLYWECRAD